MAQIDPAAFTGPMALALGFDDEVAPARVIFQYAKKHDALEIVGAITGDGQLLDAAQVKALATLRPVSNSLLKSGHDRGTPYRVCRCYGGQRPFHH